LNVGLGGCNGFERRSFAFLPNNPCKKLSTIKNQLAAFANAKYPPFLLADNPPHTFFYSSALKIF